MSLKRKVITVSFGILITILLSLLEISLIPLFPEPFYKIIVILPLSLFLMIIVDHGSALWVAFGGGVILNLFSFFPFGGIPLAMMVAIIFSNFLLNNFFTNKSFYSLMVLGLLGNIVYILILFLVETIFLLLGIGVNDNFADFFSLNGIIWQTIFSLVLLVFFFYSYSICKKRLEEVFFK